MAVTTNVALSAVNGAANPDNVSVLPTSSGVEVKVLTTPTLSVICACVVV